MNVELLNCSAAPNKNEIRFGLNVVVEPIELILFPSVVFKKVLLALGCEDVSTLMDRFKKWSNQ